MGIGFQSWNRTSSSTSQQITTISRKKFHRTKRRSQTTYRNKINKLKQTYKNLFKASQKKKAKSKQSEKLFFCDKYPNQKAYIKSVKLKEPTK